MVIPVPAVPLAAVGLRLRKRASVPGHVAHACRRCLVTLPVHPFRVLTTRHLQPVAGARKLHFLHRAGRHELQHRAPAADEVARPGESLDRGDPARDRERDLRILRPERMLGPHLGRHGAGQLVAVRLCVGPRRGVDAQMRVCVDQTWRDVFAGAVHDHRTGRRGHGGALPHGHDPAILERDRPVGYLPARRRHDRRIPDHHGRVGMPPVCRGILRPAHTQALRRGHRGRGGLRGGAPTRRRARARQREQEMRGASHRGAPYLTSSTTNGCPTNSVLTTRRGVSTLTHMISGTRAPLTSM